MIRSIFTDYSKSLLTTILSRQIELHSRIPEFILFYLYRFRVIDLWINMNNPDHISIFIIHYTF